MTEKPFNYMGVIQEIERRTKPLETEIERLKKQVIELRQQVKSVDLADVVQQSEQLTAFVDWYNKERRQYEIPEHSDVTEYLGGL